MAGKIKPKYGKIIRISEGAAALLEAIRPEGASWSRFIDSILDDVTAQEFWVLPSSLMNSERQAKAKAIEQAAQRGTSFEDRETPIKVRMPSE